MKFNVLTELKRPSSSGYLLLEKDGKGPHICRVKMMHVGSNMPCVRASSNGIATKQNSTQYSYFHNETFANASIQFDKFSNWGMYGSLFFL